MQNFLSTSQRFFFKHKALISWFITEISRFWQRCRSPCWLPIQKFSHYSVQLLVVIWITKLNLQIQDPGNTGIMSFLGQGGLHFPSAFVSTHHNRSCAAHCRSRVNDLFCACNWLLIIIMFLSRLANSGLEIMYNFSKSQILSSVYGYEEYSWCRGLCLNL